MRVSINLHSGNTKVEEKVIESRCRSCIHRLDPDERFCIQHEQERMTIKEGPKTFRMVVVKCDGYTKG